MRTLRGHRGVPSRTRPADCRVNRLLLTRSHPSGRSSASRDDQVSDRIFQAGSGTTSTRRRSRSFIPIFNASFRQDSAFLAEALAARGPPLPTATQDAVNLPKMVQVVCRFQADELLDRLPSAHLVEPIELDPP